MHLVDLLPYERGYRVAASYDALRFPEDKNTHDSPLRNTALKGFQTSALTREGQGATAEGETKKTPTAGKRGRPLPHAECLLLSGKRSGPQPR